MEPSYLEKMDGGGIKHPVTAIVQDGDIVSNHLFERGLRAKNIIALAEAGVVRGQEHSVGIDRNP